MKRASGLVAAVLVLLGGAYLVLTSFVAVAPLETSVTLMEQASPAGERTATLELIEGEDLLHPIVALAITRSATPDTRHVSRLGAAVSSPLSIRWIGYRELEVVLPSAFELANEARQLDDVNIRYSHGSGATQTLSEVSTR